MTPLPPLYPLIFHPVYKDYLWGGDRIVRRYHRQVPPGIYAESWEITDRPEDMSIVANGALTGKSLHDLVLTYGVELLGYQCRQSRFPLLIKLIDAMDRLSVQVHPDEASAQAVGGEPKTEMWYILDVEPGAVVFAGLRTRMDAAQFREALQKGRVAEVLAEIPVSMEDVIYVPGGRIHSIGAGCLLLEIQQNSDTTFRLYDWERAGRDHQPRELHIEQAMKVIRWDDAVSARIPTTTVSMSPEPDGNTIRERLVSPYFRMEQMVIFEAMACSMDGRSFHILFIENGLIKIKGNNAIIGVKPGTTVLIPAGMRHYELSRQDAVGRLVRVSLPDSG